MGDLTAIGYKDALEHGGPACGARSNTPAGPAGSRASSGEFDFVMRLPEIDRVAAGDEDFGDR
ncbi:MAG: hypothetical protein AAGJ97_12125, partial [Planctomycetota bacterium]